MSEKEIFYKIDNIYDCLITNFKEVRGNLIFNDDINNNFERRNYLSIEYYDEEILVNYLCYRNGELFTIIKSKDMINSSFLNDFICVKYNYFEVKRDDFRLYYNDEFEVDLVDNCNIEILDDLITTVTKDINIKDRIHEAILKNHDFNYFMIFYLNKPIGYVSVLEYMNYAKIEDLWILEEYRGINASIHLLTAVIKTCSANKFYVLSSNDEYYEHLGFKYSSSAYFYFKYFNKFDV